MPCMKCANGKWKYGARGNCQFDTKAQCEKAAAAIHAKPKQLEDKEVKSDEVHNKEMNMKQDVRG